MHLDHTVQQDQIYEEHKLLQLVHTAYDYITGNKTTYDSTESRTMITSLENAGCFYIKKFQALDFLKVQTYINSDIYRDHITNCGRYMPVVI